MASDWIDFRALKDKVKIREVLERYGYLSHLKDRGGGRLQGPCPLHKGRNPTSFHVDCEKGVFNCFSSCGGGNVIDLVMKAEPCDLRTAGKKLAAWFDLTFERPRKALKRSETGRKEKSAPKPQEAPKRAPETPTQANSAPQETISQVNPPLSSPLKTLNPDHPYLWARGLTAETVKTFGLGFCSRGIMAGRIAIPIHNDAGELVAYAGRAVDNEPAREGKYKLPAGFQKSQVVYNLTRARAHRAQGLIVVEGFFDAMKVHQAGFPNVVALMGSTLSEHQEQLLLKATDRLALMFDGDDAGLSCTRDFWKRLRQKIYLKEIAVPKGAQPDSLSDAELRALLGGAHDDNH